MVGRAATILIRNVGARMRRRDFIAALGGAAAMPFVARAQQAGSKAVRIGILGPSLNTPPAIALHQAFLAQLSELGFREGENLIVEYRGVDDPRGTFVAAAELMRSQPDLLLANGPEVALQALVGASGFIPIVIIAVNFDPLARGYVASLARPGGNITGVVFQQLELAQKQVELMKEAFPDRTRLAILFDAQSIAQFNTAERAAKSLKFQVQSLKLEDKPYDFDAAFRSMATDGAQMVLVQSSPNFIPYQRKIADLAKAHRLPAMFLVKFYVQDGGLMSYGANFPLMYRRAADYVARILKGAKPSDLPVEQASKFELVVNLKTAKTIGVELPTGILLRAEEVIE
jgi:putative tryptophan/tyrosine transport system substrate-binding protein